MFQSTLRLLAIDSPWVLSFPAIIAQGWTD
jgi:hypothetical protein